MCSFLIIFTPAPYPIYLKNDNNSETTNKLQWFYIDNSKTEKNKSILTSGSSLGGTGGGVTDILFFAIGGGGSFGIGGGGGVAGKTSTPRPRGLWPPSPATLGSGVSPGVSGLSSVIFSYFSME